MAIAQETFEHQSFDRLRRAGLGEIDAEIAESLSKSWSGSVGRSS